MSTETPAQQSIAPSRRPLTRRDFLRTSAVAAATTWATGCVTAGPTQPQPVRRWRREERPLRVGVIGCGGRGTGAAMDCVKSSPNISIVALGDLFADRIASCSEELSKELGEAGTVPEKYQFAGFECFHQVLACDVDLVILASPPHFRPLHLAAAVAAGKHVFMEKPVAVDPPGVRSVIASSAQAAQKRLSIVAGTQRRHDPKYIATMRRVHRGAIGRIVAAQCYWNQGALWVKEREPEWTDMEWQCRNWLYFTWLSGDHIVEQHVHNLDVINWALRATPVKCIGMGGRQARTDPKYGNIYDHFAVEYEYPNGVRVMSMCRQTKGASDRIGERLVGTEGVVDAGHATITGRHPFKFEYEGDPVNPYVQEHADLVAAIRSGRPINEGKQVAESTLTAIMGRISAYTGREVSWNWVLNSSQLDLTPPSYAFGELPVAPVAIPGETPLT